MANIGDFWVKTLPHFYEFCPACVTVVTMKSLNAAYYESTWSKNLTQYGKTIRNRCRLRQLFKTTRHMKYRMKPVSATIVKNYLSLTTNGHLNTFWLKFYLVACLFILFYWQRRWRFLLVFYLMSRSFHLLVFGYHSFDGQNLFLTRTSSFLGFLWVCLNYVRRGIQFKRGSRGGTGVRTPPPPWDLSEVWSCVEAWWVWEGVQQFFLPYYYHFFSG